MDAKLEMLSLTSPWLDLNLIFYKFTNLKSAYINSGFFWGSLLELELFIHKVRVIIHRVVNHADWYTIVHTSFVNY